jgi:dTDP-4-dehydrorhamnose 3,5-epimerase
MKFTETRLTGAYLIELEPLSDERGFFARSWCQKEFQAYGLNPKLVQCNISFNQKKGTLRGMHYQVAPHQEAKLVRCTRGAIYDVILDLRPDSETFKKWVAIDLTAENRRMLYIPEGLAHGFQTLEEETEVFYQMSEFYYPECARGVRGDDRAFQIDWPEDRRIISVKDSQYPDYVWSRECLSH